MHSALAIVDVNNFYASCEAIFNPSIKDKPVLVLSNNDGIVIAANNRAKELGLKGKPYFKIKNLIKKYDAKVFSSNYTLYGDMSARVMETLEEFSPNVEVYSIDEAFVNLDGFSRNDLTEYAIKMRKTILQWTGLPTSIGVANTKTLSKIANRFIKKQKIESGVLNLKDHPNLDDYLKATPVEDIWGVGFQYKKMLNSHGIENALDLSKANDKWVKKRMTVQGLRTLMELNGQPCIEFDYDPAPKKAIISSRSFGKITDKKSNVQEAVAFHVARAAEKMRKQKSACSLLSVFLRTNKFKSELPQYHNGVQVQLPVPTSITSELTEFAMKGVEQIFREGYMYHKVGVLLTDMVPEDVAQIGLFDSELRVKNRIATELLDQINSKMGKETLRIASSGVNRDWTMRREMTSPKFTTSWLEIPIVKAN